MNKKGERIVRLGAFKRVIAKKGSRVRANYRQLVESRRSGHYASTRVANDGLFVSARSSGHDNQLMVMSTRTALAHPSKNAPLAGIGQFLSRARCFGADNEVWRFD